MVGHQPRLVELHARVHEAERHGLVDVDRLAPRLALGGVLDGVLQRRAARGRPPPPRGARASGRTSPSGRGSPGPRRRCAGPRAAATSWKKSSAVGMQRWPSLPIFGADLEAGVVPLDDERRDALRARARGDGGEHEVEGRHAGVGDPRLLAVEHVAVRGAARRAWRSSVASEPASGSVVASAPSSGSGPHSGGTQRCFCGVGAELQDRAGEEARGADEVADRGVAPGQLLGDEAGRHEVVDAPAAVLLRDVEAREADLGGLQEDVARELLAWRRDAPRRDGSRARRTRARRPGAPAGRRSAWSAPRPLSIGRYVFRSVDLKQAALAAVKRGLATDPFRLVRSC